MSDKDPHANRKPRTDWGPEHRRHVFWAEKGSAAFCVVAGSAMAYFGSGIAPYVGAGMLAIGVFVMFEKARPLISGIVDRLPFLKSKQQPEEIEEHDGLEEE